MVLLYEMVGFLSGLADGRGIDSYGDSTCYVCVYPTAFALMAFDAYAVCLPSVWGYNTLEKYCG